MKHNSAPVNPSIRRYYIPCFSFGAHGGQLTFLTEVPAPDQQPGGQVARWAGRALEVRDKTAQASLSELTVLP